MRVQSRLSPRFEAPAAVRGAKQLAGPLLTPARDLGLSRTGLVSGLRHSKPFPVTLVSLEGAPAPMLVPGAHSPLERDPFKTYVRKLAKAEAFPDQKADISRLLSLPSKVEPIGAERPWVAIMISEPSSLLPGEFETLNVLAEMVRKQGCEPILVPPMLDLVLPNERTARREAIQSLARRFNGLIGPGGADVHPRIYKSRITHSIDPIYPRDRFEADFVTAAMSGPAFLLGVCRSHQLWNAATGGKLVQDVQLDGLSNTSQDQDKFGIPRSEPFVVRDDNGEIVFENRVELAAGSQIAELLGEDSVLTNSLHYQAVETPGRDLRVTGLVPDSVTGKDTIEATEAWNVITTQFHPELMLGDERFKRLVETVGRRAHVFFELDRMKPKNETGFEQLLAAVNAAAKAALTQIDRAWMNAELAPRMAAEL